MNAFLFGAIPRTDGEMRRGATTAALRACIPGSGRNTTESMRPKPLRLLTLACTASTAALLATAACAKLTAPAKEDSVTSPPAASPKPAASVAARPAPPAARPEQEEKISASHILVGYQGARRAKADRTKDEARKLATELAARAKKGEDFAELARKNSEGPSAPRGGNLNEFTRRQMVKPFADAAFALKVGQVSDPVETPFGFHVIKRTK
jgi:NIMA-interacting peptidyl-prolyl cis-trans isomerase 1